MPDEHFVVVGGTRGIGVVLVEHLIRERKKVSVFGRNQPSESVSSAAAHYPVDATDADALVAKLNQAVERFGKVRGAVFLQRYRGDDFDADLAVALGSTRRAIDHLVAGSWFAPNGSIVLVSSVADQYVAPEQSLGYHVSKAGLTQLGRYYALRLGPSGIRVNTVSPCVVMKDEARPFYEHNEDLVRRYAKFIPLGRMGRPEDIVNAIVFLTGDTAAYITGQNLVVDGGLTLRSHESLIRESS